MARLERRNPDSQAEILETMGEEPVKPDKPDTTPGYKILGPKIVVSKAFGKNWEKRKSAAVCAYEFTQKAWDEAYRYYNHNQSKDEAGFNNRDRTFRPGDGYENIVFANTSTMIPAIYAKNPDVSFSTDQDEDKAFATVLGKAVQAVFNKRTAPGINLKPRMKKAALHAELTNQGIVKLDFVLKEESREQAEQEMNVLFEQLEKAKDMKEVKEIEGKMQALESQLEWMEPTGFKLSNVFPKSLVIDPSAENEDGSDANWMFEETYISTDYLNAKFAEKDSDGSYKSIYKPTHKVKLEGPGSREDALGMILETFNEPKTESLTNKEEELRSYIYQNMTRCWYLWDKTTRRVYLFADNDWTWPVWAWQDPLGLSRFFPYFIFQFIPATGGVVCPGEVSFYLDQQDEINKINKELTKVRRLAFNILAFNTNKLKADDAQKLIAYLKEGQGDNAFGIDVPEGMSIKDVIETVVPPSLNYRELFDKADTYRAIDRISSVNDSIRGEQFKAGTVEDAVQAYVNAARIRIGNRTDAIEDCVGDVAWSIAEILVSKVDKQIVEGLIGINLIKEWKPKSVAELNATMNVIVAAGSSEKPTSSFKKKEAIQISQAIGQFAKAAPGASLRIILKLLRGAFPELDITEEDWNSIAEEVSAQLQRGVSTGEGAGAGTAPPVEGQGSQQGNGQIEKALMGAPPQVQRLVEEAVRRGATPQQALAPVMEKVNAPTQKPRQ
ncbi:MAG: hypothetical protein MN733_03460 [Nitrososphaera sp.]|nr:hypothetical protein [Nitrososphaera sp.]